MSTSKPSVSGEAHLMLNVAPRKCLYVGILRDPRATIISMSPPGLKGAKSSKHIDGQVTAAVIQDP